MTSEECVNGMSQHLFWDVNKEKLDMNEYPAYVIPRVLEYGNQRRRLPMLSLQTVLPNTLELLKKLMEVPLLSPLRLVGGTALALQYGHRRSIDIDLFGDLEEDTDKVTTAIASVGNVVQGICSDQIKAYRIDGIKTDF